MSKHKSPSIGPHHTYLPQEVEGAPPGVPYAYVGMYKSDKKPTPPASEKTYEGLDQIPLEGMVELGKVFSEGEPKYGRDNWKKEPDNLEYSRERLRHAIKHLMLYANGDRSEPHLAKVAWFCFTQIWREKHGSKKVTQGSMGQEETYPSPFQPSQDVGSSLAD